MLALWRVGSGRLLNAWPAVGGRILVLGHVGRSSGRRYRTPLNYAEVGGDVYLTAGFGAATDWYRNVLAHPQVEVWLPGRRRTGRADPADDLPDRVALLRAVLVASGFAARVAGVPVRRLTDGELAAVTRDYRLVRVRLDPTGLTAA